MVEGYDDDEVYEQSMEGAGVDLDEEDSEEVKIEDFEYDDTEEDDIFSEVLED